MNDVNTVTLTTAAYNQMKAENQKAQILLDSIFKYTKLSDDHEKLIFDSDSIVLTMDVLYAERYKKKLSAMRGLATKGKI